MYCVYLTSYLGNQLPPFYIGSTSLKRLKSGYKGSVASKEFASKWANAIATEPELFRTIIIKTCETRIEAFEIECRLQEKVGAVNSSMYVNKSLARKNGYFGGNQFGKENPMYGKHNSDSAKLKISLALKGKPKSKETIEKMTIARNLRPPLSEKALFAVQEGGKKRRGKNHVFYGKKRPEIAEALRKSKIGKNWWTDGESNKFCQDAPAANWLQGMAKRVVKRR